jgi:hypothetical protein
MAGMFLEFILSMNEQRIQRALFPTHTNSLHVLFKVWMILQTPWLIQKLMNIL